MIDNFGSYLKNERELRGITLETISGNTKIHIRFLQALEDNNFEELPGEVFIRGYIKSYSETIGSDPEETLNVYDEFIGNKVQLNNLDSINQSNISAIKFLAYASIGLIILALLFGAKFLLSLQEKSTQKLFNYSLSLPEKILEQEKKKNLETKKELKENSFPIKKPDINESINEIKEKENPRPKEPGASSNNNKTIRIFNKPLKLFIKVKNDSWFNIAIDSFRKEDFILQAGEEKVFFGNKKFLLTIGNKKDTKLILNGENLVIPEGKENVVKDFVITSKLID